MNEKKIFITLVNSEWVIFYKNYTEEDDVFVIVSQGILGCRGHLLIPVKCRESVLEMLVNKKQNFIHIDYENENKTGFEGIYSIITFNNSLAIMLNVRTSLLETDSIRFGLLELKEYSQIL